MPELLDDDDFRALQTPAIRAELTAYEAREHLSLRPVRVPVVAVAGRADTTIAALSLDEWRHDTSRYHEHWLDAGHLLAENAPAPVAALLRGLIAGTVAP